MTVLSVCSQESEHAIQARAHDWHLDIITENQGRGGWMGAYGSATPPLLSSVCVDKAYNGSVRVLIAKNQGSEPTMQARA